MILGYFFMKVFSRSKDTPESASGKGSKVRRRINPATASVEEVLTHLATDPASGLSHKEAERRLSASMAGPLYRARSRSLATCVKTVLKEPALWLLLAVSVICLFFERVFIGLGCLLLGLTQTALSAFRSEGAHV